MKKMFMTMLCILPACSLVIKENDDKNSKPSISVDSGNHYKLLEKKDLEEKILHANQGDGKSAYDIGLHFIAKGIAERKGFDYYIEDFRKWMEFSYLHGYSQAFVELIGFEFSEKNCASVHIMYSQALKDKLIDPKQLNKIYSDYVVRCD